MPHAVRDDVRLWRWTRTDYHHAGEIELFGDLRVELLGGEIFMLSGQTPRHYAAILLTADRLTKLLGVAYDVRQQAPIVLSESSEPEPDITVVPGTSHDYADHHPSPAEVHLLIEVADTTLSKDRVIKASAHASAGIADYWIINVIDRQLEVFRDPVILSTGSHYKKRQILGESDTISPLFAPKSVVAVADLLPPLPTEIL